MQACGTIIIMNTAEGFDPVVLQSDDRLCESFWCIWPKDAAMLLPGMLSCFPSLHCGYLVLLSLWMIQWVSVRKQLWSLFTRVVLLYLFYS